ncbi:unnamed protein product [Moneuplotes crassus]|uniref:Uncharacterized protein n=1 Tax=Euplotes crassus TaxID=5936 RepID=A0AAD1Y1M8_EUPCR|nr:unnamed protein product [Moneuplotes crassus]
MTMVVGNIEIMRDPGLLDFTTILIPCKHPRLTILVMIILVFELITNFLNLTDRDLNNTWLGSMAIIVPFHEMISEFTPSSSILSKEFSSISSHAGAWRSVIVKCSKP